MSKSFLRRGCCILAMAAALLCSPARASAPTPLLHITHSLYGILSWDDDLHRWCLATWVWRGGDNAGIEYTMMFTKPWHDCVLPDMLGKQVIVIGDVTNAGRIPISIVVKEIEIAEDYDDCAL